MGDDTSKTRERNMPDPLCDESDEGTREYTSSPCYLSELDDDNMWSTRASETPGLPEVPERRNEHRLDNRDGDELARPETNCPRAPDISRDDQ